VPKVSEDSSCLNPLAARIVPRGGCKWGTAMSLWRQNVPEKRGLSTSGVAVCAVLAPEEIGAGFLLRWINALKNMVYETIDASAFSASLSQGASSLTLYRRHPPKLDLSSISMANFSVESLASPGAADSAFDSLSWDLLSAKLDDNFHLAESVVAAQDCLYR